ncbi:MAG: alanine racemase [Flavobacteriales bacterium]
MTTHPETDHSYERFSALFSGRTLPLAWLDLDALDANIRSISQRCGTMPVRIASKSIRNSRVLEYIAAQQQHIAGIMSYSVAESVMLARRGFKNILCGYPCMEAEQISEAIQAMKETGALIIFMTDRPEHISLLQDIAAREDHTVRICIDLDMSVRFPGIYFGVFRSSLNNTETLTRFLDQLDLCPRLEIWGAMGYEAQVAGIADNAPGKGLYNRVIRYLKKRSVPKIAKRRMEAVALIRRRTGRNIEVNGGGTGSIESTCLEKDVTEVTVGSGYFQSHLFDGYQQFRHIPAAGFVLRVTRNPAPDIYTCQSGGFIASGATDAAKTPQVYRPQSATLLKNEGAGEVQTPLLYTGNLLQPGGIVVMRHAKAGELCEHFNTLHVFRSGGLMDQWPTYRGEGFDFH